MGISSGLLGAGKSCLFQLVTSLCLCLSKLFSVSTTDEHFALNTQWLNLLVSHGKCTGVAVNAEALEFSTGKNN